MSVNRNAKPKNVKRPEVLVRDSLKSDESVINEAKNAVYGSKAVEYGEAIDNHKRIADIANAIKDLTDSNNYTAAKIVMVLQALKLARMQGPGPFKRDSYVDLIGYTDIRYRIKEAKINKDFGKDE